MAGFVPVENTPLIMTNASVVIDVNYRESSNKIYLHFNGNYTIYNPNVSQVITLGAPFSLDFTNIEDNCLIKVNEITISKKKKKKKHIGLMLNRIES